MLRLKTDIVPLLVRKGIFQCDIVFLNSRTVRERLAVTVVRCSNVPQIVLDCIFRKTVSDGKDTHDVVPIFREGGHGHQHKGQSGKNLIFIYLSQLNFLSSIDFFTNGIFKSCFEFSTKIYEQK